MSSNNRRNLEITMLIVLIRHGIAEETSKEMPDSQRSLTTEGVDKFRREIPGILLLLKHQKQAQIWYSPTKRTTQTAEILQENMPEALMVSQDFIADHDFHRFTNAIRSKDIPEILIIVGHEPGMSLWSRKIAGVTVKFKKGACAGFTVNNTDSMCGSLDWFMQPSALKRIGGV
jgi:phosphohistidine phosphatase SixA